MLRRASILLLLLAACEAPTPPAKLLVEVEDAPPLELHAGTASVDLLYLHADCVERRQLTLTNLGHQPQRFTIESLSPELTITAEPLNLAPQARGTAELAFWPKVSGPHRSVLTINGSGGLGGALMFTALVVESDDVSLPARVDFGGVPVGVTKTFNARLSGLDGDFGSDGGAASFTPSTLGPQRAEAIWTDFASCPSLSKAPVFGDGMTDVLVAPVSVTFPAVDAGALSRVTVTVDNFTIDRVKVSLDAGADFLLESSAETSYGVATRDDAGALVPSRLELHLVFSTPPGGLTAPVTGQLQLETPVARRTVSLIAAP